MLTGERQNGMFLYREDCRGPAELPLHCFFGVATAAAVHSLVDFIFEIQANAMLFVALLAMGMPTAPD